MNMINNISKELQDKTWNSLIYESKNIIKECYNILNEIYNDLLNKDSLSNMECDRWRVIKEKKLIYEMHFGKHNLNSEYKKFHKGDKVVLKGNDNVVFIIEGLYANPNPYNEYQNEWIIKDAVGNTKKIKENKIEFYNENSSSKEEDDFKMGDNVYYGNELLGKFVCYSYSNYDKEVMVEVLIDSGKDKELDLGGWFAKDVSKTPNNLKRWKAKEGEKFYYFNEYLDVFDRTETTNLNENNDLYFIGNYFRTKEDAKRAVEGIKKYLEKFK